jgi:predicted transcriptional regulator
MRYRTKTDMFVQILEIAKERPVTKTRIAYDCFGNWSLFCNFKYPCNNVSFSPYNREGFSAE